MATVYIGIGSNVGDRQGYVDLSLKRMGELEGTQVVRSSKVYETDPVGPMPQGKFLNAVAELKTTLSANKLLEGLQQIEQEAGRAAEHDRIPWGPRALDLDIILFGNQVICEKGLTVPHPHMHDRWFVLKPLADLAPNAVHPVLQMSVGFLLSNVAEGAGVQD